MKLIKQDATNKITLEPFEHSFSFSTTADVNVYDTQSVILKKGNTDLENYYHMTGAWGLASSIDIYDCDLGLMKSAGAIKQFVIELCELIDMKRFGRTDVVHFGEDERVAGYSMTQLIETSLISGHFANDSKAIYLDIFSCKYYDPIVAADFAQKFFKGKSYKISVNFRDAK